MPILHADYSDINHEELAISIGLKSSHIPLILASFISETATILHTLKEHVVAYDCDKIKTSAHAIKGSAANLKLNEICEMAKVIEAAGLEKKCDFEYEAYIEAIENSIKSISI